MKNPESVQHAAVKIGSEKSFGLTIGAVLAILAVWPFVVHGGLIRGWLLGIAAAFVFAGIFSPETLRPLNKIWFQFGILLGKVMTPVIMGILYTLAILPIGLLRKALGHDPLHMRLDSKAKSYWVIRDKPPEPMINQF